MNVQFYEWPSTPGYFLVSGEGAGGQLGHIDTNMEHIRFQWYATMWDLDDETREAVARLTALEQVIKRLKS